jgi:hemolysin-activating ACP:hemolysin acyltransferase
LDFDSLDQNLLHSTVSDANRLDLFAKSGWLMHHSRTWQSIFAKAGQRHILPAFAGRRWRRLASRADQCPKSKNSTAYSLLIKGKLLKNGRIQNWSHSKYFAFDL